MQINKILTPIKGLQFFIFFINVIALFSETLLISSVSTSHISVSINAVNFFFSHLQLLEFHE